MRYLFLLFILVSSSAYSQEYELVDIIDKVSQKTIRSMVQDEAGFIWLGTNDGLNRYDGSEMTVFRFVHGDNNCICGNQVSDIVKDKKGSLWIASATCLDRMSLSDYSFTHYMASDTDSNSLSGRVISELRYVNDKLFVLSDKGLDVYNEKDDIFSSISFPHSSSIKGINKVDAGLLITCDTHIYIYNPLEDQISLLEELYDVSYTHNNIEESFIYGQELFVAYKDSIVKYNLSEEASTSVLNKEVVAPKIFEWNNKIWFLTFSGIVTYDLEAQEFEVSDDEELAEGIAKAAMINDAGDLWVVLGNEVIRFKKNPPLFKTIEIEAQSIGKVSSNNIWHFHLVQNDMIVSTSRGLYLLDSDHNIRSISEFSEKLVDLGRVSSVTLDGNDLWVGSFEDGIYHLDIKSDRLSNYSTAGNGNNYQEAKLVRQVSAYKSEVYFSTDEGLYVYDKVTKQMSRFDFSSVNTPSALPTKITYCFKDKQGRLWIGTRKGLYRKTEGELKLIFSTETLPALSNNRVRSIKQYSDSIYLIGTSLGLNVYNEKADSLWWIDTKSGLENDVIYSLEVDNEGEYWVSTNKGLSLIRASGEVWNYNRYDGLQIGEFNAYASGRDTEGYLYFGGITGFSMFNPNELKKTKDNSKPLITGLEVLPQGDFEGKKYTYPLEKSYEFESDYKNIAVSFTNINFDNPENDVFYYNLDGNDSEWVEIRDLNRVQFMNLDPGTYNFSLRAGLVNGKMSSHISSLKFTIHPAFFQTTLFKVLSFLLFVTIAFLLYNLRVLAIKRRNKNLQEIVELQTTQLRHSNDLQKIFLNEVPDPLAIFDNERRITFSNGLYQDLVNKNGGTNIPFFQEQILEAIYKGLERVKVEDVDKLQSDFKKGNRFFQLKFNRVYEDNKIIGVAVSLRDLTQILMTEKLLKQNEYLFRSFFEKNPLGIIYVENLEEPIVNCNKKMSTIVGFSSEEILSRNLLELTHLEDRAEDRRRVEEALAARQTYLFEQEKKLVSKSGDIILAETHIIFVYDDKGTYRYMFALVIDVTEQRENQKNLLEAKTKLVQVEKLASLGQIMAGVAHEINNPVNFIYNGVNNLKTLVEVLKNTSLDEPHEVYNDIQLMLEALEDGAHRTTDIVKSLRSFSREVVSNSIEYDIIEGLESTLILLSSQMKDRIRLEKRYEQKELVIPCFPGQLNQVFMNVITNAIDSIPQSGSISISITEEKQRVGIHIADTGIGIDPSISNKILDPFFSTKGPKQGTGLGLSISQSIIHKHNGEILFSKNSPQGTIVTLSLPITQE